MTLIIILYLFACALALLSLRMVKQGLRVCGLLMSGLSFGFGMAFAWLGFELGMAILSGGKTL